MKTSRLILIGGFLGAGKTTLIWETALRLTKVGLKTGLVTNDQAPDLVDTAILKHQNLNIKPTAMRELVLRVLSGQTAAISLADLEQTIEKADKVILYRTIITLKKTNSFTISTMAKALSNMLRAMWLVKIYIVYYLQQL